MWDLWRNNTLSIRHSQQSQKIIRWLLKLYKYFDLPSVLTFCTRTNAKSHVFHIISGARAAKLNEISWQCPELGCVCAALHLPVVADAAEHRPKANLPLFALSTHSHILKHPTDTAKPCSQHERDTIKPGEMKKSQRKELAAFLPLKLKLTGRAIMKPQHSRTAKRGQKWCSSVACKCKTTPAN